MKHIESFLAVSVMTLTLGYATASAEQFVYDANLLGSSESPANASPGTGTGIITFDNSLNTLHVQISFSGLTSPTTASHIHAATTTPFTGNAGVATQVPYFLGFPIGVTSGTYDHTFDLLDTASYNPTYMTAHGGTAAGAEVALTSAMAAGEAYLNIHTQEFPAGEIRGFLTSVPDVSTTFSLMGIAMTGLVAVRRLYREN